MRHLKQMALDWPEKLLAMKLYVHPSATHAISFYERFGFVKWGSPYNENGVSYGRYLIPLQHEPPAAVSA